MHTWKILSWDTGKSEQEEREAGVGRPWSHSFCYARGMSSVAPVIGWKAKGN